MSWDVRFVGGNKFADETVEILDIFCSGFGGLLPNNCFLDVIYLVTPENAK